MSQGGGFLALIFLPFLLTSQFHSARRLVLGQGPCPPGEELTTQSTPLTYSKGTVVCVGGVGNWPDVWPQGEASRQKPE